MEQKSIVIIDNVDINNKIKKIYCITWDDKLMLKGKLVVEIAVLKFRFPNFVSGWFDTCQAIDAINISVSRYRI